MLHEMIHISRGRGVHGKSFIAEAERLLQMKVPVSGFGPRHPKKIRDVGFRCVERQRKSKLVQASVSACVTPEKKEVVAISLWETKEYAELYNRELYPQIEKIMARFIEGIPVVKKFEAEYSTFHKVAFATTH
jgi:hypothetical protein